MAQGDTLSWLLGQLPTPPAPNTPPAPSPTLSPDYTGVHPPAVVGNIQWYGRPQVTPPPGTRTPEGDLASYGTVHSASRGEDGLEVLYPQIYDGKWHADDEAWQHYRQTGEHMGKFNSPSDADAFAIKYHKDAATGRYNVPLMPNRGRSAMPQEAPRYNKETMTDPEDLAIENVEKDPAGPIKERANKVARAQAATAMQRKNNPNNAFVKKP